MNDRQKHAHYLASFEALFTERSYLFNHGNPFVPLDDYFRHFLKANGTLFTRLATPWSYGLEVFDTYKDKVVWTSSVPQPDGSRAFMTVVQLDPTFHIVGHINYSGEDERMICYLELWSADPAEIPKFILDHSKHRVQLNAAAAGFLPHR